MASARAFSAFLIFSLTLASCQSASEKAANDEVKVAENVQLVCSARTQVDEALVALSALTPQSTVAQAEKASNALNKAVRKLNRADEELTKAELREYRDQVKIFRDEVDKVRKNKDLTLAEAADQLKGKGEPVRAAREQLMSIAVCVDIEESPNNSSGKKTDDSEASKDKEGEGMTKGEKKSEENLDS